MITRILNSAVKLQGGSGLWESTDGQFMVERESTWRPCSCADCRAGGTCPRGGRVVIEGWSVWDAIVGDYAFGTLSMQFRTFGEALERLQIYYRKGKL